MDKTKSITPSPFLELLGIKVEKAIYPHCRLTLALNEKLVNPMGTLHGGVISSLVDAALGSALLSKKEVKGIATLELKVNYFKAVTGGVVVAEGEIIHCRGTVTFGQARIYCENEMVAQGSATVKIFLNE
ncbi:MAG: PaaI family thioesterase [Firmicutes bacterium]|nr:PaaI family thioesterase [Bacillota bacterium]